MGGAAAVEELARLLTRAEVTMASLAKALRWQPTLGTEAGASWACCPYQATHRMPPQALPAHAARCRWRAAGFPAPEAVVPVSSSFFYEMAPAVVTFPACNLTGSTALMEPKEAKLQLVRSGDEEAAVGSAAGAWAAALEVGAWQQMPKDYSPLVGRVLACLQHTSTHTIQGWLSHLQGIPLTWAASEALATLVQAEAEAICQQQLSVLDQLAPLLQQVLAPLDSHRAILHVWQHVLKEQAQAMACKAAEPAALEPLAAGSRCRTVPEALGKLQEWVQQETAVRAALAAEPVTPAQQRWATHEGAAVEAEAVRNARTDYHRVPDRDNLLLAEGAAAKAHDKSGQKRSPAELMAELRDYKRRRASYRVKSARPTPSQAARDLIALRMDEMRVMAGLKPQGPLALPGETTPPGAIRQLPTHMPTHREGKLGGERPSRHSRERDGHPSPWTKEARCGDGVRSEQEAKAGPDRLERHIDSGEGKSEYCRDRGVEHRQRRGRDGSRASQDTKEEHSKRKRSRSPGVERFRGREERRR